MKQLNILIKQMLQFGTLAAFKLFIKSRGARITNRILKNKNKNKNKTKLEDSNFPISKLVTASVIKTMWYCPKNRCINQKNRIQSLEINSYMYSQMTFDKVSGQFSGGKE